MLSLIASWEVAPFALEYANALDTVNGCFSAQLIAVVVGVESDCVEREAIFCAVGTVNGTFCEYYPASFTRFAALKHSPSKRKARERSALGTAGRQQATQSTDGQ